MAPWLSAGVPGARAFGLEFALGDVGRWHHAGRAGQRRGDRRLRPAALQPARPGRLHPQLRLLTLIGCGTRGLTAAVFGPRRISEQELRPQLARYGVLQPGMLVLADRNFSGHTTVAPLAAAGRLTRRSAPAPTSTSPP